MPKPTLIITVGIPGSGKSTFCKNKFPQIKRESRDEYRFKLISNKDEYFSKETQVFENWSTAIANNLKNGIDCIADATHLTFKSRAKLINALKNKGVNTSMYSIVILYFTTPLGICLERNETREGLAFVPEKVIIDMKGCLEEPNEKEFPNIVLTIGVDTSDKIEDIFFQ
jgi:predicted kinase